MSSKYCNKKIKADRINFSTVLFTSFLSLFSIFSIILLASCGLFYQSDFITTEEDKKNLNLEESAKNIDINDNISKDDKYLVTKIFDGDTILVEDKFIIRLLGINAPEVDRFFYDEAKDALKTIIEGEYIYLEKDVSEKDVYGRYLRYVYINSTFVNLEMVKRGFANVFTMPPDLKYNNLFLEAERFAREKQVGLWKISKYSNYSVLNYGVNKNLNNTENSDDNFNSTTNCNNSNNYNDSSNFDNISIYVHFDASGNDNKNLNDEYVVIKNNLNYDINIKKWTVKDSSINIYEFKRKYILKSGQYLILYTGFGKDKNNKFYWNSAKPIWNNDFDTLYLRDEEGYLVNIYNYP